jgi:hypothetical protein
MAGGNGIWAALISNGVFNSPPAISSTLNFAGTDTNAVLTWTRWDQNQWEATVSGASANANVGNFNGQAAGTYDGVTSGTFEGVATGTFERPSQGT